ncbi:Cobyrinic acid ac-diamide synthase [Alicyclobacillus acidocaldarius subsp. acidocaldarius Tc-4-1]|uniref:Cobyrinic acid ac-diamide synthase n=1 Tax=Alicyclobacillus acidocaldarius (strain Tc-4-1) TaxID=1048834 RepID=F8IL81_ALIAT|nr:Cobyrinic acid ac-diamide synthase [Alicyclobacillus acidocaldarius subsp. acidocaldarius Tc-4-1]
MWLVCDHDPVRAERLRKYLEKQGVQVKIATKEEEIPNTWAEGKLALFLGGWNPATVQHVKNTLGLSTLYCTLDTLAPEQFEGLRQQGYDDVVPYPPAVEYARRWEREVNTENPTTLASLVSQRRKTTYTAYVESKPFQPPAPTPRRATVICVTGVKGGVGKTTMAVLLANAMVARGKRIVVAELDPYGNLANLFRVERTVTADRFETLPDVLTDPELEQNMLRTPAGWWLIPKGDRPLGLSKDGVARLIHLVGLYADALILDTHAGHLMSTVVAMREADRVLGVTTADRTTWTDLRAFLHMSERPVYLVLNRVRERPRKAAAISAFLQKEIGFRVAAIVHEDDTLYQRVQQGLTPLGSRKTNARIHQLIQTLSISTKEAKSHEA